MADELTYQLTYAGVPFVGDVSRSFRSPTPDDPEWSDPEQHPLRTRQPLPDLMDEINRVLPSSYLQDFAYPPAQPGRGLGGLAHFQVVGPVPSRDTFRVGDYYYPTDARRWSVFRGLATSSQAKAMLAATGGGTARPFVMKAVPLSPGTITAARYTVSTSLYMLPPRPLAEIGGNFDGLYLITLVDERYYWQSHPITLHPNQNSTWASLFTIVATSLGIVLTFDPGIETAASSPEPDSPLWCNAEPIALLFDALALNVGCCVVRSLDGSYIVMDPLASRDRAKINRGDAGRIVREAGGDLFYSGQQLPAGSLLAARNAIVPATISVSFPKYVGGDDPVPHFLNSRYPNQRPSAWYEDGYGEVLGIDVPVRSGTCYSGSLTSGITGTGKVSLRSTAKAVYATEAAAASGMLPDNASGLTALAMFLARDHCDTQAANALDEVLPGTFKWGPEGTHDLVWTWSERSRSSCLRIMKCEWNNWCSDFDHAAPALSGSTIVPRGVGGPSVAQSWRDSYDSTVTAQLNEPLTSGQDAAVLDRIDYFPTQNRWRGRLGTGERVLFEGTSGGITSGLFIGSGLYSGDTVQTGVGAGFYFASGPLSGFLSGFGHPVSGGYRVGFALRGIDGTIIQNGTSGDLVSQVVPDTTYGVNLVTTEKMQFVYPQEWTSGGVQGINVVPQTQSVTCLDQSGVLLRGIRHHSGRVSSFAAGFATEELIWLVERNGALPLVGKRYDGQFAGHSASGAVAPVYLVNQDDTPLPLPVSSGPFPTTPTGTCRVLGLFNGYLQVLDCSVSPPVIVYFCPCSPYLPGPVTDLPVTCECEECPDGMASELGFFAPNATGDFAALAEQGQIRLPWLETCNYRATVAEIDIFLHFASGTWEVLFQSLVTGTTNTFRLDDPFRCCGENRFVLLSGASDPEDGHVGAEIIVKPVGPCQPCGGSSGSSEGSSGSSGGSSGGSSSGSSGGTVVSDCCPDRLLPETLHATCFGGTGECTCLNGTTFNVVYQGGGLWRGELSGCNGGSVIFEFTCTLAGFGLGYRDPSGECCSAISQPSNRFSSLCDPLDVRFSDITLVGDCCIGLVSVQISE